MKQTLVLLLLLTGLSACIKDRVPEPAQSSGPVNAGSRKLIHYWSFNGSSLLAPDTTIGGASITVGGVYDDVTPGSLLNARRGADTGKALRVRNPSTTMTLKVPTTGYKQPLLSFAVMRTDNGPQENVISYTLDGTTYVTTGLQPNVITVGTDFSVFSFDFSSIAGAANNPSFGIRFTFSIGNTAATGNDRFDNISIDALPDGSGGTVTPPTGGDSLIHYWNFNANTNNMAVFTQPTFTRGGGALSYAGNYQDTVQEGSTLNARNGDAAGNALRLRNPAGPFTLSLPTTGFKEVKLKFAVMRTSQGAQSNILTYTLDGTSYVNTGLTAATNPVTESFALVSYDFSAISGAANNPKFKVKIDFGTGGTNTSGNDRFDNVTLEGKKL